MQRRLDCKKANGYTTLTYGGEVLAVVVSAPVYLCRILLGTFHATLPQHESSLADIVSS
jgi:hypothetical protein